MELTSLLVGPHLVDTSILLIAATALHHGRVLVTSDGRLVELMRGIGRDTLCEHLPLE